MLESGVRSFLLSFAALILNVVTLIGQTPDIDPSTPLERLEHTAWTSIGQTQLNRIFAIEQDSIGYLWIGSDKGLLRFDGAQLVKYNMRNTPLRTETVVKLAVGNNGNVYYGTNRGLYRLKDGVSKELLSEKGEHITRAISFLVDKNGQLWATARGNKLYFEQDGVLQLYDGGNTKAIRLFKGNDEQLYATTNGDNGSLFKLNPETGLERLPFKDEKGLRIRAVTADKQGTIYYINELGEAWKWDGLRTTQLCEATDDDYYVQHILLGEEGDLWFGYHKLHRILPDGTLEQFGENEGLTDTVIRDIYADAHGDVWIATLYGLNRLSDSPFHSLVGPEWPDVREHSIVQAPDDALLVGTYDDGLYWLKDGKHKKVEHPTLRKTIQAMAFDKAGNLLIGQADGLFRFRYSDGTITEKEQLYSGYVNMVHVAKNNEYVFAIDKGFDGMFKIYRHGAVIDVDYPSQYYNWITDGPDGTVWIGTRKGLNQWDGIQLKPTEYEDSLFHVFITAYTPLNNGGNWIGSYGTGLARIQDGKAYPFSTQNGLPVNQARMLLQTESNSVWLYVEDRDYGQVTHLTPFYDEDSHHMVRGETYNINYQLIEAVDGRAGNPVMLQQIEKGRAVLLGVDGPLSFEPARVRLVKPKVRIETVKVADSVYDPTLPLNLPAGARNIEFHYGAIDFYRGSNQQFEYRLSGYDIEWQNAGSRTTAYFSSLPEGKYNFEVRVLLPDGTYETSQTATQVIQKEFWYKETWAIWLYIVALMGLVGIVFRLRLAALTRQRNLLQEKVAQRTSELNELNHSLEEKVALRTKEVQSANDSLRESDERYAYAMEASNDGIWDYDVPNDKIKFSPAIYTMLGYEPNGFPEAREGIYELLHPEDKKAKTRAAHNLFLSQQDQDYLLDEYRLIGKEGNFVWVQVKGKVVERDQSHAPLRVIGTHTDITAAKLKNQEMLEAVLRTEDTERSRIAQEIHDGLQQTLTVSYMNLNNLHENPGAIPKEFEDNFNLGWEYLVKSIKESRSVAHALMPKAIMDFGILSACETLIADMNKSNEETSFIFQHNLEQERLNNQQIEITLYRILQESLNNVMKYAKASEVLVQLYEHEDTYSLTVEDNGVGFDLERMKKGRRGLGFKSMKNRLDAVNGSLEIDTAKGAGTTIMVEIEKGNS